jgi:signal transduction histidine kinase
VLQAHGKHTIPVVAGLGPAVCAVALSHLVVGHERRHAREQAVRGMQALAASEATLSELVERAPIGIISCDAAGNVRTINARMWRMFEPPDSFSQEPRGNVIELERQFRPDKPQIVRHVLETGEAKSGEIRFRPDWGAPPMQLHFTVTPLRAASGETTGAILLSEDVTERRELERRLRLAQKMEAVGQLAAGIAHELNTPMAYVRTNLRALHEDWSALREEIRKNPESEDTQSLLSGAEALIGDSLEGVERTIAIARDMREFAHSASATREPTDLNHELETCVRLAAPQRPGVTISERYGELPALSASAGQLRQVFVNLIVNALQAVSENGTVVVSSATEGGFALVRVEDDGCGIPQDLQHRLFEPFFTTKPADRGTGLGLYISYQIVRAHGGEIRVDSAQGKGARFEVRLPILRG